MINWNLPVCLFQGMVLESGIAYPMNFVKCLKRNSQCAPSEILGGNWINWFIRFEYALKTELNYYICIILPASHVVCLIFLWNLFSFVFFLSLIFFFSNVIWSIFNYYYYCYYSSYHSFSLSLFLWCQLPDSYFILSVVSYFYVM